MRRRVRQPMPVFLPCCSLRDGQGNQRWGETEDQRRELRALQDVRYRRPIPNYQLGGTGGRRGTKLRRDVGAISLIRRTAGLPSAAVLGFWHWSEQPGLLAGHGNLTLNRLR